LAQKKGVFNEKNKDFERHSGKTHKLHRSNKRILQAFVLRFGIAAFWGREGYLKDKEQIS